MSQALRKLTATIKKTNCMVIFINQIRMKIGVMFGPENHHRRQRAEVLRLGAAGHPPHRQHQEGRRGHRQRDQGQSSRTRSAHRSRPPSSTSSMAKASAAKARSSTWGERPDPGQVRRLVRLQRREDRPGQGQSRAVPARERRPGPRNREQGARVDGHSLANAADAGATEARCPSGPSAGPAGQRDHSLPNWSTSCCDSCGLPRRKRRGRRRREAPNAAQARADAPDPL